MQLAGRSAKWLNMPHQATVTDKRIVMHAEAGTDFWQKTYYHFTHNRGHALLADGDGEFSFSVKAVRDGSSQFDQCGVMVYLDEQNWAKACAELEDGGQKLGSVVTSGGYSDWATAEIPSDVDTVWYRVSRMGEDFLFESSFDGETYKQMRIFHLRCKAEPGVGVFACCPTGDGMKATFTEAAFAAPEWKPYRGEDGL